jgi:hypothetical protein
MAEPSGPQSGQPWRHVWDAVQAGRPPHESYEGELGEYACLLLERGSEQAGANFPVLARHVRVCPTCQDDLDAVLEQLGSGPA